MIAKDYVLALLDELTQLQQDIIDDMHNVKGGQSLCQAMTLQRNKTETIRNVVLSEKSE